MMVLTSVVSPCKQQLDLQSQGVPLLCFTGEKVLNFHSCVMQMELLPFCR